MSRYYDPITHRFVNADGYFQSGGSLLDTNMNAYCRNNPVNYVDYSGSIVFSTGLSVDATFGLGAYLSVNFVYDDKGNVGIQYSYINYKNNGYVGAVDASVNKTLGVIWDADTIYDLEKDSVTIGASGGALFSAGVDLIKLEESDVFSGISASVGYGVGLDVHEYTATTNTFISTNTRNLFSNNTTSNTSSSYKSQSTKRQNNTGRKKSSPKPQIPRLCRYCGRPIGNKSWYCSGGWS